MDEVGKLKEEVQRMAAEHNSLLKELAEMKKLLNKPPKPLQLLEKANGLRCLLGLLDDRVGGNVH
jgi:hypothetical protein